MEKKIFICATILFCLLKPMVIFSQKNKPIQLFNTKQINDFSRAGRFDPLKLNPSALKSIISAQATEIDFSLPGQRSIFQLKKINLFSKNFFVKDDFGNKFYPQSDYTIYQSIHADESVNLVIYKDNVSVFYADAAGNHTILRDKNDDYLHHIEVTKPDQNFECQVLDNGQHKKEESIDHMRMTPSNECVDIYFEVDSVAYAKNGKTIASATNWVVNLMAQVSLQYNRYQVPLKISGIKIYTTLDPYAKRPWGTFINQSDSVLYVFRDSMNRQGFNGRLAHLLVGRSIGGGVAYLGTLCSTYNNTAVSGNMNGGVTPYPTYSWNVNVVAHEIGHNFGSPHTHDCAWNGNNTPIDGCGSVSGCANPGLPPAEVGGTIMSYCHLKSVGINPKNGFGPQPGALIFKRFTDATCILSQDCSGTQPTNDICYSAMSLNVTKNCNVYINDLFDSNPSASLAPSSCNANTSNKDVWFQFVVPSNGSTIIETKQISGGLTDMILEAYTGDCFALSLYSCDDDGGEGNQAQIVLNDTNLYNDTIYLRVISKNSVEGTYGICLYNDDLPCDTTTQNQLISFYNALGGPSWTNNSGWADGNTSTTCDFCHWYGLGCNPDGKLISIELPSNNLSGMLPGSLLPNSIQILDLSNNNISGAIPGVWDSIKLLNTLNLSQNSFEDTIPNFYNKFKNLIYVNISHNSFYGKLSPYTGYLSKLTFFDGSYNQISGCFESSYHNLCIKTLELSNNTQLAFGGNTTDFCTSYMGTDSDNDGHCYGISDCNDNNKNIYLGAPELCDNLDNDCNNEIDEGLVVTNTSLSSQFMWKNPNAWSLGHVPQPCENVIIGDGVLASEITIDSGYLELRSLMVQENAIFSLNEQSYLSLKFNPAVVNHGIMNLKGNINVYSQDSLLLYALDNFGDIFIGNRGGMSLSTAREMLVRNHNGADIVNNGSISLNMYGINKPLYAVYNMGKITNNNYFSVYGQNAYNYLYLLNGSEFRNTINGNLRFSNYTSGGNVKDSAEIKKY